MVEFVPGPFPFYQIKNNQSLNVCIVIFRFLLFFSVLMDGRVLFSFSISLLNFHYIIHNRKKIPFNFQQDDYSGADAYFFCKLDNFTL